MGDWTNRVLVGDSRRLAADLPDGLVKTIVTSPPYYGHRDYAGDTELAKAEFGKERDHTAYVKHLVTLFTELRRTMAADGTLWLNLGDSYRSGQMLGIPWRVALGLQDAGWLLRSEIIWEKPNAMPSSTKNRPTTSHEHLFLFAKTPDYYYDCDAIREPHVTFSPESKMKGGRGHLGKRNGTPESGKNKGSHNLHDARWDQYFHPLGRNKRTVWSIPLGKFRGAHFAVFPEKLVENCVLAGSRENELVLDPFLGSGTTALVAQRLHRNYLGFELVPAYAQIARDRLAESRPGTLFTEISSSTACEKLHDLAPETSHFNFVVEDKVYEEKAT
jgi:site-specific DNA-methyltransferase (adenine-specific)